MERRDQEEEEELDRLFDPNPVVSTTVRPENYRNFLHQYLLLCNNPPETSIPQNPTFLETLPNSSLETAFAHLNLSTPSHQSPFPSPMPVLDSVIDGSLPQNPIIDPSSVLGLSPLSFQQIQQTHMEFQRLRTQERMVAYLGARGNLGRSNLMSTTVTDDPYWNFLNGVAPEAEINDCYCHYNSRNELRQFSRGLGKEYPISPCSNRNGFRFDSERSYRERSVSGLVSESENSYMKSLLQTHPRYLSLEDLRGQMVSMAKNQHGHRFLQKKFEEGNADEIEMIFSEVKDYMGELMLDQYGNYFVQKLLDVCNEEQTTLVLISVTSDGWKFIIICLDTHGTRAVQKLLERLTTPEQIYRVMLALSLNPVSLTKCTNGHHVIQNCLKYFSAEDNKYLLNAVADNCVEIAKDKSGCCLLKQCVQHSQGELRERFMAEITENALILAEDRFGNYVVQYILELKTPHVTADLLRQLEGRYASLSVDKYGSNVVELCIKMSGEEQSTRIIMELINSSDIFTLIQDPFGNYVIQRALEKSKGHIYNSLVNQILLHSPSLRCHPYGRRVLERISTRKKAQHI
ncbi:hypothetical protein HHK36_008321 [Tetracentron sinense]|uniref:PUM-HD domain-containing protein n=1 Tax=Tetracentron sinense TaxID=13715 RepID=A0A834ZMA1_TETSI|nr:hypothetical protein HHK36_008321 [Tetracentron sinense]